MLYAALFKELAEKLGFFDRNGADKHRLSLFVTFLYLVDNGGKFRGFGLIDEVVIVLPYHRLVGRNLNNIKGIYLLELLALGHGGSRHTGKLFVESEIVLEGYCRKSFALMLNLDALLRLNGLMQTLVIASAEHDASGELIDYEHLTVLDNVIDVAAHDAYRLYSLIDVVLYRDI